MAKKLLPIIFRAFSKVRKVFVGLGGLAQLLSAATVRVEFKKKNVLKNVYHQRHLVASRPIPLFSSLVISSTNFSCRPNEKKKSFLKKLKRFLLQKIRIEFRAKNQIFEE